MLSRVFVRSVLIGVTAIAKLNLGTRHAFRLRWQRASFASK
jgi:hypothetical protein